MSSGSSLAILDTPADQLFAPRRRVYHRVSGLQWARFVQHGPVRFNDNPKGRTAAQRRGIRFERSVRKPLRRHWPKAKLWSGKWIEFWDSTGHHYAQPDYLVLTDSHLWIFECKLRQCGEAEDQLLRLYSPLLAHLVQLPQVCVEVVRFLAPSSPLRPVAEVSAIDPESLQAMHLWCYLG